MKYSKSLKIFLGNLQAECMEELWKRRTATVKEIWNAFKKRGRKYAYTTILTEMQNLEKKGLVKSERKGRQNVYTPLIKKEKFLGSKLDEFLTPIIREFPEIATAHFLKKIKKLSPKDRKKIEEILKKK